MKIVKTADMEAQLPDIITQQRAVAWEAFLALGRLLEFDENNKFISDGAVNNLGTARSICDMLSEDTSQGYGD